MDCVPEEKITQPEPGALKRIASSFGLGPLTTNSQPQAQSEDTSMHVPASASPESNYTRRYSFLPEDSMDSFDEQEGNESTTKSVDSRPAIRSIPSKSSMEIDRQSQANMLLDDQVDTARATAVFGSSKSSTLPNQTMAFGSRALAEQEFSFQSPAAAPKMPPVPSISSFFQTFMGTEKSHKPDRFAAAHEYQFSKLVQRSAHTKVNNALTLFVFSLFLCSGCSLSPTARGMDNKNARGKKNLASLLDGLTRLAASAALCLARSNLCAARPSQSIIPLLLRL